MCCAIYVFNITIKTNNELCYFAGCLVRRLSISDEYKDACTTSDVCGSKLSCIDGKCDCPDGKLYTFHLNAEGDKVGSCNRESCKCAGYAAPTGKVV